MSEVAETHEFHKTTGEDRCRAIICGTYCNQPRDAAVHQTGEASEPTRHEFVPHPYDEQASLRSMQAAIIFVLRLSLMRCAAKAFDAVKTMLESEHDYSALQIAAMVSANVRAVGQDDAEKEGE